MESGLGIMPVINWVNYIFPSLTNYTHILAPITIVVIGLFSVFSKILPPPKHQFAIPDIKAIEAELGNEGMFIIRITKLTRLLTISINWLISTKLYNWWFTVVYHLRVVKQVRRLVGEKKHSGISLPEKFIPHAYNDIHSEHSRSDEHKDIQHD